MGEPKSYTRSIMVWQPILRLFLKARSTPSSFSVPLNHLSLTCKDKALTRVDTVSFINVTYNRVCLTFRLLILKLVLPLERIEVFLKSNKHFSLFSWFLCFCKNLWLYLFIRKEPLEVNSHFSNQTLTVVCTSSTIDRTSSYCP